MNLPHQLSDYLPATALVAIAIFIAREVLEASRRRNTEKRKIQAMKIVLARECELNLWTIRRFQMIFDHAPGLHQKNSKKSVRVEERPYGYLARMRDDDYETSVPVPDVHRDTISKLLMDTASLQEKLFKHVESAHDALSDLEHVRDSLVHIHETERDAGIDDMMSGLADYAKRELKDVEDALKDLYRYCTGQELKNPRLR